MVYLKSMVSLPLTLLSIFWSHSEIFTGQPQTFTLWSCPAVLSIFRKNSFCFVCIISKGDKELFFPLWVGVVMVTGIFIFLRSEKKQYSNLLFFLVPGKKWICCLFESISRDLYPSISSSVYSIINVQKDSPHHSWRWKKEHQHCISHSGW